MGAVDSMKKLQGWTDTTITHFYELTMTGNWILSRSGMATVRYRKYSRNRRRMGALLQAGDLRRYI